MVEDAFGRFGRGAHRSLAIKYPRRGVFPVYGLLPERLDGGRINQPVGEG